MEGSVGLLLLVFSWRRRRGGAKEGSAVGVGSVLVIVVV